MRFSSTPTRMRRNWFVRDSKFGQRGWLPTLRRRPPWEVWGHGTNPTPPRRLAGVPALTLTGVAGATIPGSTTGRSTPGVRDNGALRVIDFETGITGTRASEKVRGRLARDRSRRAPERAAGPTGPPATAGS